MSHRMVFAAAFAVAGLLTSTAYAGSPYYDADGQSTLSSDAAGPVVHRHKMMAGSWVAGQSSPEAMGQGSVAAGGQPAYTAATPRMDPDGFEHREPDSTFYEHAVGSDGSVAESDDTVEAPKPAPVYNAPMPKMDPDGFMHKESDSVLYEHAVGSDGAP